MRGIQQRGICGLDLRPPRRLVKRRGSQRTGWTKSQQGSHKH